MRSTFGLLVLLVAAEAHAVPVLANAPIDWNDGHAEVDGYELLQPRYGEIRRGHAVMVFVKEELSESARVKADPGHHPASDVFPVLKLNLNKSFRTGIYDYSLMTSVFTQFGARNERPAGAPTKIVFSNQEWCGAVFEELLFDPRSVRRSRFSYFDGEGDERQTLEHPADGLALDAMPILVRQIQGVFLEPGKSRAVKILPSLERTRLIHRTLAWTPGSIARSGGSEKRTVPAGTFEVEVWTVSADHGETYKYWVEKNDPRRLVEWEGPDGERGRLTGSARLKYWELHKEGDERFRKELGLKN